ncbi:MAG: hemin uptake protein HemP [Thiobacillus sp.]|nr:hemin uptake protein HemP [Thiobacillus sp.]
MTQTSKPARIARHPDTPGSDRLSLEPGQQAAASGAIPAEQLFKGVQEIRILHKGDLYRLRITRNDKLLLTK